MRAFHAVLGRAEAILAGTFLLLMVGLIFLGGVARMAGHPLNWTTDLATCLFAWACFLCADIAWRNQGLMSIEVLTSRLPVAWHRALLHLNYALIAVFLAYVVIAGINLAYVSRARTFQGIPGISYAWVTLSLPAGAALLLLTTLLRHRDLLRGEPQG